MIRIWFLDMFWFSRKWLTRNNDWEGTIIKPFDNMINHSIGYFSNFVVNIFFLCFWITSKIQSLDLTIFWYVIFLENTEFSFKMDPNEPHLNWDKSNLLYIGLATCDSSIFGGVNSSATYSALNMDVTFGAVSIDRLKSSIRSLYPETKAFKRFSYEAWLKLLEPNQRLRLENRFLVTDAFSISKYFWI